MAAAPAPIRIGCCLSLTGPLADNSRSARLTHEIWQQDINSRGGLLGRPVELVCHDDHAGASLVPEIYERLIEEDKPISSSVVTAPTPSCRPCRW
ncbi:MULTISPECIES: ABC transporter substrate-binding protein [Streptomyces]|uniref:ABC transporter substrate-binding protein n=1 Tax=Streptomyces milbemycinicus TaxID=476552 RepID=A0ABW8M8K1_9ACTN